MGERCSEPGERRGGEWATMAQWLLDEYPHGFDLGTGIVRKPTPMDVELALASLYGSGFHDAEELKAGARRLRDLQEQRADFERLYAVSATLAGAESLTEGLPQIVGTICTYLDAQIGVVFLYQPDDHSLKIMSPMWVNGHTLDVGDLKIRVTSGGIIPQVFRSGKALHLENIDDNPDKFGVVGELGMSEALIAPLRVEGFNVGVIAIGDPVAELRSPSSGSFLTLQKTKSGASSRVASSASCSSSNWSRSAARSSIGTPNCHVSTSSPSSSTT